MTDPRLAGHAPLSSGLAQTSPTRAAISAACRIPEPDAVAPLLAAARVPEAQSAAVRALALELAGRLRSAPAESGRSGLVQSLLQEYALSSQEGVALMCLAEALLRIPDSATRDALIRDKIGAGEWRAHLGQSPSLFVNAATWGLLLTGRLVSADGEAGLVGTLTRLACRGSEPLIRRSVDVAVRLMGDQFVAGETISAALEQARAREAGGFRHSFDMLGEAALTADDAERYRLSYETAIDAIGAAARGRDAFTGPGISIKLSALHPRYARAQRDRVLDELYPVLRGLVARARAYGIGVSIDAEESERLELSLELLERLCLEPGLQGWDGLGFVIQAYQKRCPRVIDHLIALATQSGRRLMVRLVKGAYWDSEIKRAQLDGLDYPVYTRKAHTDVAYLACARQLLAAPAQIFPQFATHNAHTVSMLYHLADPARWHPQQYEFQCLHGMGEPLYRQVVGAAQLDRPCRIYAPVGAHESLLAYLVRRLLENGANTSFVHRVADPDIPLEDLIEDPVAQVDALAAAEGLAGRMHPRIPAAHALYGSGRRNSAGLDLASDAVLARLDAALARSRSTHWQARPRLVEVAVPAGTGRPVRNPAHHAERVGEVVEADEGQVALAVATAETAHPVWAAEPLRARAERLRRCADALQDAMPELLALLIREAGKTCANGLAEVREAIDFLRYYAAELEATPGADRTLPLGVVVCISPWNFPLAIFVGQIAAALAAGNVVIAKPAEQTPLIADLAVQLFRRAGLPAGALQLLPGEGAAVGGRLVADPRVQGVVFTGSTEVARRIQATLAQRLDRRGQPVTLIAETGGQNAMIVDSSALAEQVVVDILASSFDSAGQRCSALRVLCVQEEAAAHLLTMLRGAMAELTVGSPDRLATDVGPVIDAEALARLQTHVAAMAAAGCAVSTPAGSGAAGAGGTFLAPTLIEIDDLSRLREEVFGPVLHVLRFRREGLPDLIEAINDLGYGLTFGLHTRIEETIAQVTARARVGNLYVNRNMVGAVVGAQPFGGEGLSGTGPKAGGPLYLWRLCARGPEALLPNLALRLAPCDGVEPAERRELAALLDWAETQGHAALALRCRHYRHALAWPARGWRLAGPTGQEDRYQFHPRRHVVCLAGNDEDRLVQLAAVLAAGAAVLWPAAQAAQVAALPEPVRRSITLAQDWWDAHFDVVLHQGSLEARQALAAQLARRPGPLVTLLAADPGNAAWPLERLLIERSVSINTAAAGGNATLMTLAG